MNHSIRLYNSDLAPAADRRWGTYSIASIWFACLHNMGVYTAAAGFFLLGVPIWQVLIGIFLGLLLTWAGAELMGRFGFREGVPLPVAARVGFGVFGANIPALVRGGAAVAWYGIQTFLASHAVQILVLLLVPSAKALDHGHGFLGLSPLGWLCFLFIWGVQLFIAEHGMEAIRKTQNWAGAVVSIVMISLAVGLTAKAGFHLDYGDHTASGFSSGAAGAIVKIGTLLFVVYATMILNFCDFTRFSPTRRSYFWGNFFGLPVSGMVFAVTVLLLTGASYKLAGKALTEPTDFLQLTHNRWLVGIGAVLFIFATLGVNIIANLVSPAFDLANVNPARITFRRGALIASAVCVVVMPWKLFASPVAINYFLGSLGAMLGPMFGVIVADYYLLQRQRVDVDGLYSTDRTGPYFYSRGFNWRAIAAALIGVAVSVPLAVVPDFAAWSWVAWYAGTAAAAISHVVLTKTLPGGTRVSPSTPSPASAGLDIARG
ncbi:NCS1 family nucleobase:cation symporter-1 [Dactylosporangium maewongense]|uniref:NCS1 family nucleobase:cation symporter-1 n=1 Tax=Dactylosporangium maewongense TaxID=634393 RepID=A0ABN2CXD9_9ACTN